MTCNRWECARLRQQLRADLATERRERADLEKMLGAHARSSEGKALVPCLICATPTDEWCTSCFGAVCATVVLMEDGTSVHVCRVKHDELCAGERELDVLRSQLAAADQVVTAGNVERDALRATIEDLRAVLTLMLSAAGDDTSRERIVRAIERAKGAPS